MVASTWQVVRKAFREEPLLSWIALFSACTSSKDQQARFQDFIASSARAAAQPDVQRGLPPCLRVSLLGGSAVVGSECMTRRDGACKCVNNFQDRPHKPQCLILLVLPYRWKSDTSSPGVRIAFRKFFVNEAGSKTSKGTSGSRVGADLFHVPLSRLFGSGDSYHLLAMRHSSVLEASDSSNLNMADLMSALSSRILAGGLRGFVAVSIQGLVCWAAEGIPFCFLFLSGIVAYAKDACFQS